MVKRLIFLLLFSVSLAYGQSYVPNAPAGTTSVSTTSRFHQNSIDSLNDLWLSINGKFFKMPTFVQAYNIFLTQTAATASYYPLTGNPAGYYKPSDTTSTLQTIANFYPKGDRRYYTKGYLDNNFFRKGTDTIGVLNVDALNIMSPEFRWENPTETDTIGPTTATYNAFTVNQINHFGTHNDTIKVIPFINVANAIRTYIGSTLPGCTGCEVIANKMTALDNSTTHYPASSAVLTAVTKARADSADAITANTTVAAWGNSLTYGFGSSKPIVTSYPGQLSLLTGYNVVNLGISGQTSTQITARFLADTIHRNLPTIIEVGRNDLPDTSVIHSNLASIISALNAVGNNRYLIITILNKNTSSEYSGTSLYNTIVSVNNYTKTLYPGHVLAWRDSLVAHYNPSLPQDVIDHGHDVPPTSLTYDGLHENNAGYALEAAILAKAQYMNVLNPAMQRKDSTLVALNNINAIMASPPAIGAKNPQAATFLDLNAIGQITAQNGINLTNGSIVPLQNQVSSLGISNSTQFLNIYGKNYYATSIRSDATDLTFYNPGGTTQLATLFGATGDLLIKTSTSQTDAGYRFNIANSGTNGYFAAGSATIGTTGALNAKIGTTTIYLTPTSANTNDSIPVKLAATGKLGAVKTLSISQIDTTSSNGAVSKLSLASQMALKVSTIGVTSANGVSATSSGGINPRLTVTLNAITPSSINISGLAPSFPLAVDGSKNVIAQTYTGTFGTSVQQYAPLIIGVQPTSTYNLSPASTINAPKDSIVVHEGNTLATIPATALPFAVTASDLTAQTTANTSVATYTTPAIGTYRIGGYVNITAVTIDVIEMQVTYTDENSTSQTANFFTQGATSALLSAIGNSAFPTMDIRCKSGTAITVKTTLTTGTGTISYDTGATIQKLR